MARKDWYTVRDKGDQYEVIKFDEDFNPLQTYHVGKQGENAAMCDCYAGAKLCRHKQMIPIFEKHKRIDSGYLHNFDKNLWHKPLTGE